MENDMTTLWMFNIATENNPLIDDLWCLFMIYLQDGKIP